LGTERQQGGYQRIPDLKRFAETFEVIGQPVVVASQWADVENHLFLRDFVTILICNPGGIDESQIILAVIFIAINKHKQDLLPLKCAYAPTYILYNNGIKKARVFLAKSKLF
jgi:hypothetical protein